mgnify:FL=1
MSYTHIWGILASITGIAATYSVIKNRKPASAFPYGICLTISIMMVCLGITTIILEKYDSICAILFGITFLKITYNDRHTFPPGFTIDYINYLKGYAVGFTIVDSGILALRAVRANANI